MTARPTRRPGARTTRSGRVPAKAAAKAKDGHAAALADAARALQGLHDDWKDAVAQHTLRIEAQFREVQRHLKRTDLGRVTPSRKQAERWQAAVESVRVKPKKGRGKDLRDVERVLQGILRSAPQPDE